MPKTGVDFGDATWLWNGIEEHRQRLDPETGELTTVSRSQVIRELTAAGLGVLAAYEAEDVDPPRDLRKLQASGRSMGLTALREDDE